MANSLLNVVKIWSLIGTIKKPNLMASIFNLSKQKSLPANEQYKPGSNFAILDLSMKLRDFETKSQDLSQWKEAPLVYEALISGLLFQTACKYVGLGSSQLQLQVRELQFFLQSLRKTKPLNSLGLLPLSGVESTELIHKHNRICKTFLGLTGVALSDNVDTMMSWVLAHKHDFSGGDELGNIILPTTSDFDNISSGTSENSGGFDDGGFFKSVISQQADSSMNWGVEQWSQFRRSVLNGKATFSGLKDGTELFAIHSTKD